MSRSFPQGQCFPSDPAQAQSCAQELHALVPAHAPGGRVQARSSVPSEAIQTRASEAGTSTPGTPEAALHQSVEPCGAARSRLSSLFGNFFRMMQEFFFVAQKVLTLYLQPGEPLSQHGVCRGRRPLAHRELARGDALAEASHELLHLGRLRQPLDHLD